MISLLDCTLRDGGYVNDWCFGHNNLVYIFERLVDAGVEMIEVGFLDERRPFDMDRSIMPDTASVRKIYGHLDKKNSMVIAMIDYGTCGIENIEPCKDSYLDGIRVIFKKNLREPALKFCKQLKDLGYKVFAQLVSVTTYSDEEMMDLIHLANEVKPYAVSMVDTYGLMHQNNLEHYFELLDKYLDPSITMGYHGHNNFQMGYANSIAMMNQKTHRDLAVDGSLYGMGKSAGNTPMELIMMHMNRICPNRYDIAQVLEAIDTAMIQFYQPATWGYNLFYYIAASNNCHPNYVSFLMKKRTLSVKSIDTILKQLFGDKALLYDEDYAEKLYVDYQNNAVNDDGAFAALEKEFAGRNVLLLGPCDSVRKNRKTIRAYIEEKNPLVVSVNCAYDDFQADYVFLTNSKKYVTLATRLSMENDTVIATSNVTKTGNDTFAYTLNYANLIEDAPVVVDNAYMMCLKAFRKLGISETVMAGFDGYSKAAAHTFIKEADGSNIKDLSSYLNDYIRDFTKNLRKEMCLRFLTKSLFSDEVSQ